ncbi:MAG TPA: glycosyltransferase family 2 protein [Flavisolibacter sp.]|nr:glycosyltransferase family 2 protein [Flavisolibacter sp.]
MRPPVSVVIICKNEEHIIGETISSARAVAGEILVYDTGSTDQTIRIARSLQATVIEGPWEGYGRTKQKAISFASNDWILNLDADEVPDAQLQQSIKALTLDDERAIYQMKFRNFMGKVCLEWGEFGFDSHVRLFNRKQVNWNDNSVHEKLIIPAAIKVQKLKGAILHYTMKDTRDYSTKAVNYALLNAEHYLAKGKKATWIKQYVAPSVTFLKYYVLRLGFLDGWAGLFSARMAFLYTYLKYARLHELEKLKEN